LEAGAGLVPPALLVTGVLMWWNRVLRRAPERPRLDRVALNADVSRLMVDAGFG